MERARVPALVVVFVAASWLAPWATVHARDAQKQTVSDADVRPFVVTGDGPAAQQARLLSDVDGVLFLATFGSAVAGTILEYRTGPEERTRSIGRRTLALGTFLGLLACLWLAQHLLSGSASCQGTCDSVQTRPGAGPLLLLPALPMAAFDLVRTLLTRPPQAAAR